MPPGRRSARVCLVLALLACASGAPEPRASEPPRSPASEQAIADAEQQLRLAILNHRMGDYDAAAKLYARALDTFERELPPDHPNLSTARNNLAVLARDRGEYARAEALLREELALREARHGPDHPRASTTSVWC